MDQTQEANENGSYGPGTVFWHPDTKNLTAAFRRALRGLSGDVSIETSTRSR